MFCNFIDKVRLISLSEWFALLASTGTALTAYFSWRAITQAEEISFKPIIGISEMTYYFDDKKLNITVVNLSKDGDRFARDLQINLQPSFRAARHGYLSPGEQWWCTIDKIEEEYWNGKTLNLTYRGIHKKRYCLKYALSREKDSYSVDFCRIN